MAGRGEGKGITFLRERVGHVGKSCLIWPFSRRAGNGYGQLGFEGGLYYAHRLMCELVHGPAPSDAHHAAHSCGKGHEGCVHPKHLSWKTPAENQADMALHGTHVTSGRRRKLTPAQVLEIKSLKDQKSQAQLAEMFDVRRETISKIHLGKRRSAA